MQAIRHGLIDGKELFTDSTFLKANGNKGKFVHKKVTSSIQAYLKELNEAIDQDREAHGKKPFKKKTKYQ